jgi:hypothetical protein
MLAGIYLLLDCDRSICLRVRRVAIFSISLLERYNISC